jgi:hypothetical protein
VVQVRPLVTQAAEGYDQVQALFGGNVNGESKGLADALICDLNLNTSRLHLWPEVFGAPPDKQAPVTPAWAGQFGVWMGRKPLPPEEVGPAWEKWYKMDFASEFMNTAIENGIRNPNSGGMFAQPALQKAWGQNDNIVFLPAHRIDGSALQNLEGAKRYYSQYLDAMAKYAPWLKTTFIQLTNEPNYGWFTGSFAKGEDPVAGWIKLFNAVDEHLRKTHPETRLLGPCLASCAFFSWGDWQNWTVPILKGVTHDLEYYNYHNYETAAVSHLAWMEMLQAQAQALGKKLPRAVITEMNDDANTGKAGRKYEWWAEQMFYGLESPDKFHLFSYFLTVCRGGGGGNLVAMDGGACSPTDTFWLLHALRQTRGSIRHVEPFGVTDLKAFACSPKDDTLVVSLFNNTGRPAKVTLRSGLPKDAKIQSLERWAVHRQADLIWHADETINASPDLETELSPGAVQSFVWTLAEPTLQPKQKVEQFEFYAKTVGEKLAKPLSVPLETPRLPNEDESVTLRFAVATDDVLAARGLTAAVNGYAQSVAWTEAPREETRAQRSIWWMELPIPRAKVAKANTLEFSDVDAAYRLMFASLVYRQHTSPEKAKEAEAKALAARQEGVSASFAPLGPVLSGDRKEAVLTLENRRDRPVSCAVSLALPPGLTLEGAQAEQQVDLPAKRKQDVRVAVKADDVPRIQFVSVQATVEEKGGDARVYPAAAVLYPKRMANRFARPPVLDGKFDEWPETDAVSVAGNGRSARLRLGWDEQCLYLAAEVKTGKAPAPPANPGHFWEGDVLELFLDVGNKKSPLYTETDGQFYFCPFAGADGKPSTGHCTRVRQGDAVVNGSFLTSGPWEVAFTAVNDGYALEIKLPWSVLDKSFAPKAGTRVGMDVAIAGFESLFGTEGKPFDRPKLWGVLDLK